MTKIILGICALIVLASPSQAQSRYDRSGFWIGFGVGGGVNVDNGLDGQQLAGGAGYFRLGGTPSSHVLLGFEGIGWARYNLGETLARGNGTFTVMVFPSDRSGFFVKGGVGGASVTQVEDFGFRTRTAAGFGATLGLGADVKVGRNIYLTPNVDWLFQAFDSSNFGFGFGRIPNTNSIILFTLGLTWH